VKKRLFFELCDRMW